MLSASTPWAIVNLPDVAAPEDEVEADAWPVAAGLLAAEALAEALAAGALLLAGALEAGAVALWLVPPQAASTAAPPALTARSWRSRRRLMLEVNISIRLW